MSGMSWAGNLTQQWNIIIIISAVWTPPAQVSGWSAGSWSWHGVRRVTQLSSSLTSVLTHRPLLSSTLHHLRLVIAGWRMTRLLQNIFICWRRRGRVAVLRSRMLWWVIILSDWSITCLDVVLLREVRCEHDQCQTFCCESWRLLQIFSSQLSWRQSSLTYELRYWRRDWCGGGSLSGERNISGKGKSNIGNS